MSGEDSGAAPGEARPSAEPAAPDPLIGMLIAERYRVEARLGTGGMGAVYRAEHVLMKKPVALKVLHREMTLLPEVVKRFEREAIAAGRIDHPNVAVATDFGKLEDGLFYLVLEYVQGRSLSHVLKADGPFPADRALFVTRQIAGALVAAHAADIVHRDLKPDNVMLIERGGTSDFVKVLDFGIAKVNDDTAARPLTRLGSIFGTPQYMAPEQAAGKPVDGRADLYSLGLVLYELLAGQPAFSSGDVVALLTKQLMEAPPPLPENIDPDVVALVMKLVEKEPKDRVQSAAELAAILDARLGPLALPPDSTVFGIPSLRGSPSVALAATARVDSGVASGRVPPGAAGEGGFLERARELSRRAARGDGVRILGRDVSFRAIAVLGGVLLAGVLAILSVVGKHSVSSTAPASGTARAPEPEVSVFLAPARAGDRTAIAALEQRPDAARTAAEWAAIGLGHAKLDQYAASLPALERAVAADPSLASDPDVLVAVRRAADPDDTRRRALDFAAGPLGAGGADILFDVWAATTEKTDATTLAKSLLDRDDVHDHASPALRLALDLRRTTRCDDVKKLLPVAIESGDERSFRPLMALGSRHGCGFLGLGDCFSCLRTGHDLGDAQKAAQSRKGPRF